MTTTRTEVNAMHAMAAARAGRHGVLGTSTYRWSHAIPCVTGAVVFADTTKLPATRLSEASP